MSSDGVLLSLHFHRAECSALSGTARRAEDLIEGSLQADASRFLTPLHLQAA